MTAPNLANLMAAAPLTAHYTTVAAIPDRQFAGHCLCGWSGEAQPNAGAANQDANDHEDGAK